MKHFFAVLAVFGAAVLPVSAQAQTFDWRAALEQTTPVVVSFANDYETTNQRQLPVYFDVSVQMNSEAVTMQSRALAEGNIFEIRFLTTDGAFLEYVTLSTGTVDAGDAETQLQYLYDIIVQFVYPSIQFSAGAEVLGGRIAQIAGQPAVEFLAIERIEGRDTIVARIVGVIAPNQRDVVFIVQQSAANRMGLAGPNEMAETFGGIIADTVKFTAYRADSGAMVPF